jgi:cytochrome d ubiquinol oxidase subunit I
MDALLLARMQFAANITFHILFRRSRSASAGCCCSCVALAVDRRQGWLDAYRFWTKVFALTFALGVVSGITMSFQFGTNWPGFMEKVGNIAGRSSATRC